MNMIFYIGKGVEFMIELINSFDKSVIEFIQNNLHSPIMDKIMVFITTLGDTGLIWIIIGLALVISNKYRKVGFMVLGALLLGSILGEGIIKNIVQRDRPFINMDGIDMLINTPITYSFPSGHTTSSFAAAGVLAISFKNKSVYVFVLAGLIAFSRLYLGVHFPTDIIAGIILGLSCSFISVFIGRKILGNNAKAKKSV